MKAYIDARNTYIQFIRQELLGPGSEISIPDAAHELISSPPEKRYSIGILFPQEHKVEENDVADENAETMDAEDKENEEKPSVQLTSVSDEAETDDNSDMNTSGALDEEVSLASQNMPSSFGMTFFVRGNVETIRCHVNFAMYQRARISDCKYPFHPDSTGEFTVSPFLRSVVKLDTEIGCLRYVGGAVSRKEVRKLKEQAASEYETEVCNGLFAMDLQARNGYVRIPFQEMVELDFDGKDYLTLDACEPIGGTPLKLTALRRRYAEDLYSVTIMGVNTAADVKKQIGLHCIFQPEIRIHSAENQFVFADYQTNDSFEGLSAEDQSLAMQYRHKKSYGTGRGTTVHWEIDTNGCGSLYTDFFPLEEVPTISFSLASEADVTKQAFSMKYLSDLNQTDPSVKIGHLEKLTNAYAAWIARLSEQAQGIELQFRNTAEKHIRECRHCLERMQNGLEILKKNSDAWTAFSLANRAIYMQRVHLQLQQKLSDQPRYPKDKALKKCLESLNYLTADQDYPDAYAWRPFQIAFMLMSIASVTYSDSEDRSLIDLIWFPTGGGKTEAYLGLTAMTIFYRRLRYPEHAGGTTVIMRYTMRLLTAQQFIRASTLICACEFIRSNSFPEYPHYDLGKEPITIGLWIGREHTPNKVKDDADKKVYALEKTTKPNDLRYQMNINNKFQLLKCPWCGTMLTKGISGSKLVGEWGYKISRKGHFVLRCPNQDCYFDRDGILPIQVVDEELYQKPPTLLFATVDKFAMLPFYEEIGNFFAARSQNRTPELIIQDELHLISGPLGSMVGLYEAAIDVLCSAKGIQTKIIASTATIRCAREQCAALYNREVRQFPPPGLDAEDSFFAREEVIDHANNKFGRIYVGLLSSGRTKAMMEISAASAMLQRMKTADFSEKVKDAYWTLTMYFNSLKDLGHCEAMMTEDIPAAISRMWSRSADKERRFLNRIECLTSHESTTRLNETMDRLEKAAYSEDKNQASDVVLATNMISVGIDIPRLNTMLIVGQPKLTNEYIQASSRIGRKYPGVAFVLYDSAKSRDRSHYEQFHTYHQTFYRFVEPTSVTPFSKPARERALHAVLISILRHRISEISGEDEAGKFCNGIAPELIEQTKEELVSRAAGIMKRIFPDAKDESDEIRQEIGDILARWSDMAEQFGEDHLYYGKKYMFKAPDADSGDGRLMKDFETRSSEQAFKTMTSMRNVDTMVRGELLVWRDDNDDSSEE